MNPNEENENFAGGEITEEELSAADAENGGGYESDPATGPAAADDGTEGTAEIPDDTGVIETTVNTVPDMNEKAEPGKARGKDEPSALMIYDLVETIALALAAVFLILTIFLRTSMIQGSSMYPTLHGGDDYNVKSTSGKDALLISNFFYDPEKGDIIVFQTSNRYKDSVAESLDHLLVKRVIAVGGDTMKIDFENWTIEVNGELFEEGYGKATYVNYGTSKRPMDKGNMDRLEDIRENTVSVEGSVYTVKIPEGKVFVMGDNRNNSIDSRRIGFIDTRWIAGKALFRIFPFDRIGTIY